MFCCCCCCSFSAVLCIIVAVQPCAFRSGQGCQIDKNSENQIKVYVHYTWTKRLFYPVGKILVFGRHKVAVYFSASQSFPQLLWPKKDPLKYHQTIVAFQNWCQSSEPLLVILVCLLHQVSLPWPRDQTRGSKELFLNLASSFFPAFFSPSFLFFSSFSSFCSHSHFLSFLSLKWNYQAICSMYYTKKGNKRYSILFYSSFSYFFPSFSPFICSSFSFSFFSFPAD